jgi:predicted nucleotidyltransferase
MISLQDISLRPNQQAFLNQFVETCQTDERVVAAFLGGSNSKGYADPYSDIDLCVITTEAARQDFFDQRASFLQSLGELAFLEDFGNPDLVFFIFADGTEGELNFDSEDRLDRIHSGVFIILLDKKNILANAVFPEKEPDSSRQMKELHLSIYGFWHEMSHFITATGRGQLWWARGQLDQLRAICVNLARLENNFFDEGVGQEPYFKVDKEMPAENLAPLATTFCPLEKNTMLESVQVILRFYIDVAQRMAQTYDIPYPRGLERVMTERLKTLMQ